MPVLAVLMVTPCEHGSRITTAAEEAGRCQISTDRIDFGQVLIGQSALDTVVIRNFGQGVLSGRVGIAAGDPYRVVAGDGRFFLGPGQARLVVVEFAPSQPGATDAEITLGTGCPNVACEGLAGEPPPICAVDPPVIDFGLVLLGFPVSAVFTVDNTGGQTLAGDVALDPAGQGFRILRGGGPFSLTAQDPPREVEVVFDPTVVGDAECRVLTGTDGCEVTVTANAEEPAICFISPPQLTFGEVGVSGDASNGCGQGSTRNITIRNDGGQRMQVTVRDCEAGDDLAVAPQEFGLDPGQDRTIAVTFDPSAVPPSTAPGVPAGGCGVEVGTDAPACGTVQVPWTGESVVSYHCDLKAMFLSSCSGSGCHAPVGLQPDFTVHANVVTNVNPVNIDQSRILRKPLGQEPPHPTIINTAHPLYRHLRSWLLNGFPNN